MNRSERLSAVLDLLADTGLVDVDDIVTTLGVSPATARRDLDSLGMAGLPIYSKQGRGGGWQLIGTTDVTLWDETSETPAAIVPGTIVRFQVVER